MVQDKFLDSYIEDVYSIGEEKNNVFLFRGDPGQNKLVTTTRPVTYLGNNPADFRAFLETIQPDDALFIHWYDNWIAEIVYSLPNRIYVMLWGGEFYCDPFWYHQWVYDSKTFRFLKECSRIPNFKFSLNFISMLKGWRSALKFQQSVKKEYLQKNNYIGRIDFFVFLEKNDNYFQDYHKIKELYPAFKAKNVEGFYDQNFDRAIALKNDKTIPQFPFKVLLGNSSNNANNHLDAFEVLKKRKEDCIIYCPLSYGADEAYVSRVIEEGTRIFGSSFIPITDFMSREDYVTFLDSMDIIFMFHNRQQAFGNICSGLSLGKPVFLKQQNTLRGYLSAMDIKIYDTADFPRLDLLTIVHEAQLEYQSNIEKLKAHISTQKRLQDLKKLLTNT